VYAKLRATGKFDTMTLDVDEAEHSLEMHLPYLVKLFNGQPFTLVPIVVGALTAGSEAVYGQLLAPFLDDPATLVVISSDFCHWGRRFQYTPHDQAQGPIHEYVEALDRRGMRLIESGDTAAFSTYLHDSGNTICGRHPIGVLLHMMANCSQPGLRARFLAYAQSSRAVRPSDSSVSYAAAVVQSP
jgi:AmmeMemoRadiSam system protein B